MTTITRPAPRHTVEELDAEIQAVIAQRGAVRFCPSTHALFACVLPTGHDGPHETLTSSDRVSAWQ